MGRRKKCQPERTRAARKGLQVGGFIKSFRTDISRPLAGGPRSGRRAVRPSPTAGKEPDRADALSATTVQYDNAFKGPREEASFRRLPVITLPISPIILDKKFDLNLYRPQSMDRGHPRG